MDPEGNRIGTNQGYAFNFPPDDANYASRISLSNRIFGELNVLNEVIVAGNGVYKVYTGGTFNEKIISYEPLYVAEITLIPPGSLGGGNGGSVVDVADGTSDGDDNTPSEGFTRKDMLWGIVLPALLTTGFGSLFTV